MNKSDQQIEVPSMGGGEAIGDVSDLSMQPPISTSSPEPGQGRPGRSEQQNDASHLNQDSSLMNPAGTSDDFRNPGSLQEEAVDLEQERADLIEVYLKMKQGVATYEGAAEHYREEVAVQLDKNKAIETENSSQLRHLESVNMMTKYQIVVTKLETTVYNIARATEAKKELRLQRFFSKMADHARIQRQKVANKKRLVCLLFETKLTGMVCAFEKCTVQRNIHSSFARWRNAAFVAGQAERTEAEGRQALESLAAQIASSEQEQA